MDLNLLAIYSVLFWSVCSVQNCDGTFIEQCSIHCSVCLYHIYIYYNTTDLCI